MSERAPKSKLLRGGAVVLALLGAGVTIDNCSPDLYGKNVSASSDVYTPSSVNTFKLINGFLSRTRGTKPPVLGKNQKIPRCFPAPLHPEYNEGSIGDAPNPSNFNSNSAFDNANQTFLNKEAKLIQEGRQNNQPITLPFANGLPEGLPSDRSTVSQNLLKGIVKIVYSADGAVYSGSGFVTKDSYGQEVVVTAAHIGSSAPLKQYSIQSTNGRQVTPTGGCYINENININKDLNLPEATFVQPNLFNDSWIAEDIAIFTIPQNLGVKPLQFASNQAQRADWIKFTNFQNGTTVGNPNTYYGLTVDSPPLDPLFAITGIVNNIYGYNNSAYNLRVEPGASGGVATVGDKIVGMSVAGNGTNGQYQDSFKLSDRFNLKFNGATYGFGDNQIAPDLAILMTSHNIVKALSSPEA